MAFPTRRSQRFAVVLCGFVCTVAVVIWNAPANWLARFLQVRTGGVLLLADADGTVWSGSAVLGIAAPEHRPEGDVRLALPGRVSWRLDFDRALAPVLHLSHDGVLVHPIEAKAAAGGIDVGAGALTFPAALLVVGGPPFNTLQPEGQGTLSWGRLRFAGDGRVSGDGSVRMARLALGLSPVRPLGTYLVTWTCGATGLVWQLGTESGPLVVTGNGVDGPGNQSMRVVLRVAPNAASPVRAQLGPLLDTIGRRGPEEAVIESGTT